MVINEERNDRETVLNTDSTIGYWLLAVYIDIFVTLQWILKSRSWKFNIATHFRANIFLKAPEKIHQKPNKLKKFQKYPNSAKLFKKFQKYPS